VEAEARQVAAEGPRCALNQEAWPQLLRLQEPCADAKHKLIRHYAVSDAAVHDSQKLDGLLNKSNNCNDVFADSAYRSTEIEAQLRASGYRAGFTDAVGATTR
jgi:IS5 family transposase